MTETSEFLELAFSMHNCGFYLAFSLRNCGFYFLLLVSTLLKEGLVQLGLCVRQVRK